MEWTAKARNAIAERKYRYISSVYPWIWLQISVVAGVVFVCQADWLQLDE